MKKHFTIKSVLIALLAMISCTMKAEIVEYTTDDGFAYSLDTETQEASLAKYSGDTTKVIISEFVIYEGKKYKVTSLGSWCVSNCSSLTSIVIPSSVTSWGFGNFQYCVSLKTVICKMKYVIGDRLLFIGTPIEDAILYVPKELLDTYKSADPWSGFGTILPWTKELEVSVDDTPELAIALNTYNGNVVVSDLANGTPVSCYTLDGRMLGKASADGDTATFTAEPNSVVIVKAGNKSFKVYVK